MTAWSQEAQANAFFKTLRESLVEYDRRLTRLEALAEKFEHLADELEARHDESQIEAALRRDRKWREQIEAEHTEHTEHTEHFLAPPLPWWARSTVTG